MKQFFLCLLVLGGIVPVVYGQGDDRFDPTFADIEYGEDYKQKVDIFLPESEREIFPTILLLHGNGYSKWDMQPLARHFVGQGYAAIAVEYRNPQLPQDAFCALAWTHMNAEIYGFDGEHLVVLGHSLGGFGAALLGVTDKLEEFMEGCPYEMPAENSIQGVILYAAGGIDPTNERDTGDREFIETHITDQIDGNEPPFLIIHGENDRLVPQRVSENFAATLELAGVEYTLVLLPSVGHFFINPESEPGQLAIGYVDEFLLDVFSEKEID